MGISLNQICSFDNLALALNYAKDGAKRFFMPDFFRHQDYIHDSKNRIKELSFRLKRKEYRPKPILEIDIPKSGLAVRPGIVLDFEDFIVLYAILLPYLEKIEKMLPDNVYSLRLVEPARRTHNLLFESRPIPLLPFKKRKTLAQFEEWYEAWPEFDSDLKKYIEKEKYTHLAVSDITAYFENISHEVLRHTLLHCMGTDDDYYPINLLMDILSQWTTIPPHGIKIARGIPQGNDISSYLGNIYLSQLDTVLCALEKHGEIKYLRYMDDVKILAKSRASAMKALFEMNKVLRGLQLNVQGSKTDIYEQAEMLETLYDPRLDKLNPVVEEILERKISGRLDNRARRSNYETLLKEVVGVLRKLKDSKDLRLFKRSLTGFTAIRKGYAITKCMSYMRTNPILTDKIVKYFKVFPTGDKIGAEIYNFVFKSKEALEYQAAKFIEVFAFKNNCPTGLLAELMGLVKNAETHWAIRTNALISLSYLTLQQSTYRELRGLYKEETNYFVKRAFLLCFIGVTSEKWRSHIVDDAKLDSDRRVSMFAKYLWDILVDMKTQKYELSNLALLTKEDSLLLVDESYKFLLLRESKSLEILKGLDSLCRTVRLTAYPLPVRLRIEETKDFVKQKLDILAQATRLL